MMNQRSPYFLDLLACRWDALHLCVPCCTLSRILEHAKKHHVNTNPGKVSGVNQLINLPRSFMRLVGAFRRCNGTPGSGPLCSAIHCLARANALSTSRDFGALHRNKSVPFLKHICNCYYFSLYWTILTILHNVRCSWCNRST